LQLKLNSIIDRIPEGKDVDNLSTPDRASSITKSPGGRSSDTELPGEGPTGCPEQYHSPVLVFFHKWAKIILSLYIDKVRFSVFAGLYPTDLPLGLLRGLPAFSEERSQPDLASGTPEVCSHHRAIILCTNTDSALRHCHGFMEKFIQLATDPDFQPFHWSWPGYDFPLL
jgi:hypothetical protein